MTLTEKIKDIREFYERSMDLLMILNDTYAKDYRYKVFEAKQIVDDIILHEFEKIRDDVKNDTTEEKKLVEIVENLKKETKND